MCRKREAEVSMKEFLELEEELRNLKEKYHIKEEKKWWHRVGDFMVGRIDRPEVVVSRKKYIKLAMSCGWLCGAHRFYTGQRVLGILYLLFCWTGIPFTMTLIDLMIALPKKADQEGNIVL